MERNPRIEYGNVELDADEFEHGKFRMTMDIDLDLVNEIRKRAASDGMKYQPWINKLLREVVMGEKSLSNRVAALEREVFKKRA